MRVEVEDGVLHAEVDGDVGSPTVVLWNGARCTTRMWDRVTPKLESVLRVVRFDVRGTGLSAPAANARRYTLEQYAADVNVVLDSLDVEKAHHWAMAWGSRAALAYASLYPERMDRLALFDASIGKPDVKAQRRGHQEAVKKQVAAGIEPFEFPERWNHNDYPDEVPKALAAARSFDLESAADSLAVPTLVAVGDHDPNRESSGELAHRARDAELVVMENVGHGSILQRPDMTTTLFADFLRGTLD
ncbi:MAG: alpha/beta hydrolase [Acidobacteriota bacterium]|nr:alpha/beta hydrolase [Acidobacteriota bacterium]